MIDTANVRIQIRSLPKVFIDMAFYEIPVFICHLAFSADRCEKKGAAQSQSVEASPNARIEMRKDYAQAGRNLSTSFLSRKIWRFSTKTLSKFTLNYLYFVSFIIVPHKNYSVIFPVHIIENSITEILFNKLFPQIAKIPYWILSIHGDWNLFMGFWAINISRRWSLGHFNKFINTLDDWSAGVESTSSPGRIRQVNFQLERVKWKNRKQDACGTLLNKAGQATGAPRG